MNRASAAIKEYGEHLLANYLPRRTKRLMFLASFFARAKEGQQGPAPYDDPMLEKLNKLMGLSNNDAALKLPVHLSKAIWHGKTLSEIVDVSVLEEQITPDLIDRAAKQIIAAMPRWLRYGRPEDIEKDVKQLLVHRQILTS
jgi:hypothetical protein